jgi:hypothetical protein
MRAPCLWRPSPASLADGAGAPPEHPISRPQADKKPRTLGACPAKSRTVRFVGYFLLKIHSRRRHVLDSHHQSLEHDWSQSSSHIQAPSVLRMHRGVQQPVPTLQANHDRQNKSSGTSDVVWPSINPVRADIWSKYFPDSAKRTADWSFPWVCGGHRLTVRQSHSGLRQARRADVTSSSRSKSPEKESRVTEKDKLVEIVEDREFGSADTSGARPLHIGVAACQQMTGCGAATARVAAR